MQKFLIFFVLFATSVISQAKAGVGVDIQTDASVYAMVPTGPLYEACILEWTKVKDDGSKWQDQGSENECTAHLDGTGTLQARPLETTLKHKLQMGWKKLKNQNAKQQACSNLQKSFLDDVSVISDLRSFVQENVKSVEIHVQDNLAQTAPKRVLKPSMNLTRRGKLIFNVPLTKTRIWGGCKVVMKDEMIVRLLRRKADFAYWKNSADHVFENESAARGSGRASEGKRVPADASDSAGVDATHSGPASKADRK